MTKPDNTEDDPRKREVETAMHLREQAQKYEKMRQGIIYEYLHSKEFRANYISKEAVREAITSLQYFRATNPDHLIIKVVSLRQRLNLEERTK